MTTTKKEAAQDNQVRGSMPGSSDDHLRQPPTDERDVIEQDIVTDTESHEVSGDKRETGEVGGSEQGVRQMEDDEMDVAVGEQRRRRVTSKQDAQHVSPEGETSKRQKREATIAAIKEEILHTVPDVRPDLEQVHNFHACIRTTRSHREMESGRGRGFRRENLSGSLGGRSVQGEVKVCGQGIREHARSNGVRCSQ